MKYQLVFQFDVEDVLDYDKLVLLEDQLIENLSETTEVDGHDFGSKEFNIFVLTDRPEDTFEACERAIRQHHPRQEFRAAYRACNEDEYVILWPRNLTEFKIA